VAGPFQLIIVGDPLCRPWAVIPTVSLPDLKAGQTVRGVLQLKPVVHVAEGHAVDRLELYVDGRRQARFLPGDAFEFDSAQLADGHHELRIVAITSDAIESQGRVIVPLTVANHGPPVRLTRVGEGPISVGDTIRLKIAAPAARRVVLFQNRRPLEQLNGSEGIVEISADLLGRGPVEIQAVSEGDRKTVSAPLPLVIE